MTDRSAKLAEIRDRQNRWLRERQAEMDRESVVAELQHQHGASPQPQQQRAAAGAARPGTSGGSGASGGGGGGSTGRGSVSVSASYSGGSGLGGGGGGGGGGTGGVLPATLGGVGGVKPEEVIDRLTERITDRLRSELKVELQRESERLEAQQSALDTFLVKELESQNTCPICYELMVPPTHAPFLLFPCGHTFCSRCLDTHIDRNRRNQCPVCRKKIDSRAPNYSLQQLIQQVVAKREAGRGPGSPAAGGGPGGGGGAEGLLPGDGVEAGSAADRVRRQYERAATRMRVIRNELSDTAAEEEAVGGRMAAAAAVVGHLQEEEAAVLKRLAGVQAELALVRDQLGAQGAKAADLARQAEAVRQRRELLQATLGPLEGEVEKLELLMGGVGGDGEGAAVIQIQIQT